MGRVLKILVLQCFIVAVSSKSIKLQFEFEDMLKLLPLIGNSASVKKFMHSLSRSRNIGVESSTFGKYNNPYHPEDDIPGSLESDIENTTNKQDTYDIRKVSQNINNINNDIIHDLKKERESKAEMKREGDIEKDNENYIRDKQSMSEDELTDLVSDVSMLSSSIQKITNTKDITKDLVRAAPKTRNRTNFDDRHEFKALQRRFVLKNSENLPIPEAIVKDSFVSQGEKSLNNEFESLMNVSTKDDDKQNNVKYINQLDKLLLMTANWNKSSLQDKKEVEHVEKRDLGAKQRRRLLIPSEPHKYAGFVLRPELNLNKLVDHTAHDMKYTDNLLFKLLKTKKLVPRIDFANLSEVNRGSMSNSKPKY